MATEVALDVPLSELVEAADHWQCPVCSVAIVHSYRPGRKRVYCSDACKQRAYRWRCRNGVRVLATPWRPANRSRSELMHAVRPDTDFVGKPHDARRRRVSICGTFAHVAPANANGHTEFVPGGRKACRSCTQLIGADPAWHTHFPVTVEAPHPSYIRYRPPEERLADYLAQSHCAA